MKKVYIAGDGLKKGNQLLRAMERDELSKIEGVVLYNPWDNKEINDKSKEPTAESIFREDTKAILESDIIVADIHNDNVGTTFEMGQVWGINYMRDLIVEALLEKRNIWEVINKIPRKTVYWHTTDIRDTDIPEKGIRRSHSYNQYLIGGMLDMAGDRMEFSDIVKKIRGEV